MGRKGEWEKGRKGEWESGRKGEWESGRKGRGRTSLFLASRALPHTFRRYPYLQFLDSFAAKNYHPESCEIHVAGLCV